MDKNKRLSILNNPFLIEKMTDQVSARFTEFEGEYLLTTQQVADFYDVEERTI